ncbi:MAG TPA: GNAT family N-acetyltransferase [Candidatus Tyrphobacter sp.]
MSEAIFTTPTDEELRLFAEMRCRGDVLRRFYATLAQQGVAWIARRDEEAVGIVFAGVSDEETVVHELFVRPPYRRCGIGSRLLEEATREARSRFAIVDAADGISHAFAIRHGATMDGVLLQCAGAIPREEELLRLAAAEGRRFEVAPLDLAAHRFAIEALDREVRGAPLGADHAILDGFGSGSAFFLNDEFVGYAYVWPDGRIGPLVASAPSYLDQIYAFALAALTRRYGASWAQCLVPGGNARILRTAIRCGLTVETAWLTAREREGGDPSRYVACHPLLY